MAPRIWLITGASSGFGLQLTKTALSNHDIVIATSRNPSKLEPLKAEYQDLHPMHLDQNQTLDAIKADMATIVSLHGRIDILVNNAAYVQTGTLEETNAEETMKNIQANILGPLNVYRAVLPYMRQARSGTLVTIGSMNAWVSLPGCNLYNFSKAAIRSIGLGIADEVRAFGIKHCLVEPGAFRTTLLDPMGNFASTGETSRLEDYKEMNRQTDELFRSMDGRQPGDVVKGCRIIYEVVTGTGVVEGRKGWCEYLPLGSDAVDAVLASAEKAIQRVREWEVVAKGSDLKEKE